MEMCSRMGEKVNIKKYRNTEFADVMMELLKLFAPLYTPFVYMELGTKDGYIFNRVSPYVDLAVGVDINIRKSIVKYNHVELYEMKTDDFVEVWESRKEKGKSTDVNLLFIDADHERTQVLKDFLFFSKYVKQDSGLILLHDTYPIKSELAVEGYCHNAWETAWKIRVTMGKEFEIVTLPGPWAGLSIIRKANKQIEWL